MPKKININDKTYKRLSKYATGFMTPSEVIDLLLDKVEGVDLAGKDDKDAKPVPKSSNGRDLTKYEFQGSIYSKSKLVHAVVKQYVHDNPLITYEELEKVFPPELQAFSMPVIMEWNEAVGKYGNKTPKRFYLKENMKIEIEDGYVAVCTQWGVENVHNFINQANLLNLTIIPKGTTPVSKESLQMERQCRICGGWKSIASQYSYPPTKKRHYWCKDCFESYNSIKNDGEDPIPWIRSMQSNWNYIPRKVNPDRQLTEL